MNDLNSARGKRVIEAIRALAPDNLRHAEAVQIVTPGLMRAAYREFGTWSRAVEAAGFQYPEDGHRLWCVEYYRERPEEFIAATVKVTPKQRKYLWAFRKEAGISPNQMWHHVQCQRCKEHFDYQGVKPRKYCDICRPEVNRETSRIRSRRRVERLEQEKLEREALGSP